MKTKLQLYDMRAFDIYHTDEFREAMIDAFFPESYTTLIQDLSNVTSAFYGFLIKEVSQCYGPESADRLSQALFYELGRVKTAQALQKLHNLPKDTRGIAIVIISAIFNASPEYNFEIKKYSKEHTIIEMKGIDRYYRICTSLNITELLTWPVLTPFFIAIKDELRLHCNISNDLKQLASNGETRCIYEFKNKN